MKRASVEAVIFSAVVVTSLAFSPVYAAGKPHYFGGVPDVAAAAANNGTGVPLAEVRKDSPAEQAGLKSGDVVVQLGDTKVRTVDDLVQALRVAPRDQSVRVVYIREGQQNQTEARLIPRK